MYMIVYAYLYIYVYIYIGLCIKVQLQDRNYTNWVPEQTKENLKDYKNIHNSTRENSVFCI